MEWNDIQVTRVYYYSEGKHDDGTLVCILIDTMSLPCGYVAMDRIQ